MVRFNKWAICGLPQEPVYFGMAMGYRIYPSETQNAGQVLQFVEIFYYLSFSIDFTCCKGPF
jgi:hypothetical protein